MFKRNQTKGQPTTIESLPKSPKRTETLEIENTISPEVLSIENDQSQHMKKNILRESITNSDLNSRTQRELKNLVGMYDSAWTSQNNILKVLRRVAEKKHDDRFTQFIDFGFVRKLMDVHKKKKDLNSIVSMIEAEIVD